MRIIALLFMATFALVLPAADFVPAETALGHSSDSSLVKVRVASFAPGVSAVLGTEGGARLVRVTDGAILTNIAAPSLRAAVTNGRLFVRGLPVAATNVIVQSVDGIVAVNGIRYRGDFLLCFAEGRLGVVNRIDVEEYLRGVLPHEVDPKWHPEALKAQAIAARSYVLSRASENSRFSHDVDNSTASQVYRGMFGEKPSTDAAVAETKGLVMIHKGRIAVGFFHSCCGGMTEDSGNVWSVTLPYLTGVKSPWCATSPQSVWGAVIPAREAAAAFGLPGDVVAARIGRASSTGRAITVWLRTSAGREITVNGSRFREALGVNRVRSKLFSVRMRGPYLQVLGRGWGHGVGMCQWCSATLARQGRDAAWILGHFYQGVSIVPWRIAWPMN